LYCGNEDFNWKRTMNTYSQDPLHPDRLRCDRCGTPVAPVGGKEHSGVENLTAKQVRAYFPVAAGDVGLHEVLCGWEGADEGA
jgi:hypothetical protein